MGKKRIASQSNIDARDKFKLQASKKIKGKKIEKARVYIQSTFNNTIITLSDLKGNVIVNLSAGKIGFTGAKRSTPYAAMRIANALSQKISHLGVKEIEVYVKGTGPAREGAIRALANEGFNIIFIKDVTPIPFGGPRPPKPRRV